MQSVRSVEQARAERAGAIAEEGGIHEAMANGVLTERIVTTLSEALVLGLLLQEVRTFLCVLGHGSTEVPFEAFFLAARDTLHTVSTLDILNAVFDDPPPVKDPAYFEANPYAAAFYIRQAERLMGWTPRCYWREFGKWEL